MDLDDSDAPTHVPSRVSRFAPKSSKKLNAKPKPESGPQELEAKPIPKPEPQVLQESNPVTNQPSPKHNAKPEPKSEPKELEESDPVTDQPSPKPGTKEEPKSHHVDPMDDEEKTVLREIDVFFNPSSVDPQIQLYVMQYPLRSWWRPYEFDERCDEVRLKPESSQVEIDLSLDVESINYDRDQKMTTKQTLSSNSWNPQPHSSSYAVGFYMGNKLYVHPLHAVLQLRPSLQRNIINTKKQKNVEDDRDKYQNWVPLKYHGSKTDVSAGYVKKMLSQQEIAPISFTMNPCEYVTSLCPGMSNNSAITKGGLIRFMLQLPLQERLMKLLLEGRTLHRFSAVKYFAPEYSEDELLGFLQQHAILVQGLWAPKSALLYPQGSVEDLARDYVLLLFSKNLKVQFSQLNVRQEYARRVKNFLNVFGVERAEDWKSGVQPVVYWRFRERPDVSFEKLHPNVVEKQREVFRGMEQKVFGDVQKDEKSGSDKSGVAKRSLKNIATPSNPKKLPQTRSVGKQK